jgi:predicted transcriptional regulator
MGKTLTIKIANEADFFSRGRKLAKLADLGKRIPAEQVLSFEDPADLFRLLSAARLEVFRAIKASPASITGIAQRLKRDRSAVKRDVDELARAGIVNVESKCHPGHGQLKEVRVAADRFRLEAVLA